MAGTTTVTTTPYDRGDGRLKVITISAVGDAADGGSVPSTSINTHVYGIEGWYLESVKFVSDTDSGTVAVNVLDSDDDAYFTNTFTGGGTSERVQASNKNMTSDCGYPHVYGTIDVTIGNLGNSGEAAVDLEFVPYK